MLITFKPYFFISLYMKFKIVLPTAFIISLITFILYPMHIPCIFQASEPGTVFHVIPSAPPSPRANSLPLPHGAFACTSRVVTCSDLGQDVAEASSYTQFCRADVAEPCVYTVL